MDQVSEIPESGTTAVLAVVLCTAVVVVIRDARYSIKNT